ncbi:unnamed protein product [Lathyrus oleraceus]|uniref:Uncharacterized protein n=2 Tax=Pisum sativum TaxID=3888 RepID=A0A9D4VM53_PEA|nr:hypothetical protein KIW84_072576 [Pisum sativum]KAI5386052.1 hypothetical protein KIW84_072576 [Pisum sativum]KAI5386058.1 hypothetical protein KIW84_072582 [Pisum sativum]KAI5386063.1 hypothetical protein KIW84_072585 [Pisum sativum]
MEGKVVGIEVGMLGSEVIVGNGGGMLRVGIFVGMLGRGGMVSLGRDGMLVGNGGRLALGNVGIEGKGGNVVGKEGMVGKLGCCEVVCKSWRASRIVLDIVATRSKAVTKDLVDAIDNFLY